MGMPRYLKDKFGDEWRTILLPGLHVEALVAGAYHRERVFEVLKKKDKTGKPIYLFHVTKCFVTAIWRRLALGRYRDREPDNLERVAAKLYVGINSSFMPEWRDVIVPRYFVAKLEKLNESRRASDMEHLANLSKIQSLQNKVFRSRRFPAQLRAIILERDGYRCTKCLRDRVKLAELGRHLQIDHIRAWIDGGLTTYSNGTTLCDECNKGKHHAKEYDAAISALKKLR